MVDHACINLLIPGSYTLLALVSLRGPWGWSILGVVWCLALAGILAKALATGSRGGKLSTALYLAMGWLVVIATKPILANVPPGAIAWIVAGGLAYTAGIVFFAWQRLHFNHAIWHVFVVAGSVCHYMAVLLYVIPRGG